MSDKTTNGADPAAEPERRAPAEPKKRGQTPMRDEGDIFIAEVEEDLRREQMLRAAKRFGPTIGGVVAAVVIGVGVYEYIDYARDQAAQSFGAELIAAAQAGRADGAEAAAAAADAFVAAAESQAGGASGSRAIARFLAADARRRAGDDEAALAILASVAEDAEASPKYRHLATLKAAMIEAERAPAPQLVEMLTPLTEVGAPYRALALEQIGLARLKAGEVALAREAFVAATLDAGATEYALARLRALLDATPAPAEATQ